VKYSNPPPHGVRDTCRSRDSCILIQRSRADRTRTHHCDTNVSPNCMRSCTNLYATAQNTRSSLKSRQTPWPQFASELYRPSNRRLSAKLMPTLRITKIKPRGLLHLITLIHPNYCHYAVSSKFQSLHLSLAQIFFSALCFCSSHNVRYKVSHPYRTTGKIIVLHILIFTF
jgi:hypothetical protein